MSDNARIQPLPLQLANQIAAGEVIERPASVVKELVENSLDAGATHIKVIAEGAGSQLIQVVDNGAGIHADDLVLALSRHATSKLVSSDQLSEIVSLGFRGEALPSIASVSELTLTSRQADSELAWQIKGHSDHAEPTRHPQGTSVEVRDLFFNLPARRRFLRTAQTEQQHILQTMQRLALSRFDCGFECIINGQRKLNVRPADTAEQQIQRIASVCGRRFGKQALSLDQQFDDIHLHGWIGGLDSHRPQNDVQYFFINGRVVRDRLITHAIRQAFGEMIPAGRQPAYVLYLDIPLERVDVNVHPTKHEVRFQDARLIHGLIHRAITDTLEQPTPGNPAMQIADNPAAYESRGADITNHKKTPHAVDFKLQHSPLLHQRYALSWLDETPYLIDLQQAQKAALTEQLTADIRSGKPLTNRPVLVPVNLNFDESQRQQLQTCQSTLKQLGFEFEISADSVRLRSFPTLFSHADLKTLCQQILGIVSTNTPSDEQLIERLRDCLPSLPIPSPEAADRLLQQFDSAAIRDSDWCRELDPALLSSLFSVE